MKRQSNLQLSGRRLILPALAILTLSMLALPSYSEAGIRIGAKLKTPNIRAVFNSDAPNQGLHARVNPRYRDHHIQITKVDRKIARKLAKRTIYTKHELIQLRRAGYTWNQIGRLLRLPSKLMHKILKPYQLHTRHWDRNDRDRCEDDWDYRDRYDRRPEKRSRTAYKGRIIR